MIEVIVLGSSGSYATPTNPCTGYLVRTPDAAVLLDCGPGTLGPLQQATKLEDITAVILTHCHPDHWLELPILRNVFRYFRCRNNVALYGTAETRAMDHALSAGSRWAADPFNWNVIDETRRVTIRDQVWSFSRTDHPVETLAARIDCAGASVAYTSDTGPAWGVAELGQGIDLVLYDASHLRDCEGRGIPHSSAREAGERAAIADVGRLIVTHLVPGSDPEAHRVEAAVAYGGGVEVALPGNVYVV